MTAREDVYKSVRTTPITKIQPEPANPPASPDTRTQPPNTASLSVHQEPTAKTPLTPVLLPVPSSIQFNSMLKMAIPSAWPTVSPTSTPSLIPTPKDASKYVPSVKIITQNQTPEHACLNVLSHPLCLQTSPPGTVCLFVPSFQLSLPSTQAEFAQLIVPTIHGLTTIQEFVLVSVSQPHKPSEIIQPGPV